MSAAGAVDKPTIAIAHLGGVRFFTDDDLERFGEVGTVLDAVPIGAWHDPRADALLRDADVILGHWGCPAITLEVLDRAPKLGLFAYAAGTLKDLVCDELFERGVRVTSGARANAEPVAEFTLAAILFAGKDVFWRRDSLRERDVRGQRQAGAIEVGNWDKTIGVVGASLVGRRVLELLAPFPQLRPILFDPFVTAPEAAALGATKVELDQLCATADVVSIHAPDLPATRHLIGADQLALMRTGATLINTARGALVDHAALAAEAESGRLYLVLDVTDPEPLPREHPLRTLPNVFLTPHLAGSQGTELRRMAIDAADEIDRWRTGQPARNEVRREQLDRLA
jgi:phosphoglycerate dehydrogenase-like enzyme